MNAPPTFDAILFDLDGTLADSARDIALAIERALSIVRVSPPSGLLALVDGSPLDEIFAAIAPGADAAQYAEFAKAYREEYERHGHQGTTLFPGVRDTLEALAALRPRIPLAVATTKRSAVARQMLEVLEAAQYFDRIEGSGGTNLPPKPAPDLLIEVCRSLEVAPSRALMVGDTLRDVHAGRRAGMRTAAVTFGMGNSDSLVAARPDYVLEEFDELLVILGVDG
jgi:phosphoglycolate phosphatase